MPNELCIFSANSTLKGLAMAFYHDCRIGGKVVGSLVGIEVDESGQWLPTHCSVFLPRN